MRITASVSNSNGHPVWFASARISCRSRVVDQKPGAMSHACVSMRTTASVSNSNGHPVWSASVRISCRLRMVDQSLFPKPSCSTIRERMAWKQVRVLLGRDGRNMSLRKYREPTSGFCHTGRPGATNNRSLVQKDDRPNVERGRKCESRGVSQVIRVLRCGCRVPPWSGQEHAHASASMAPVREHGTRAFHRNHMQLMGARWPLYAEPGPPHC
jgi:hypothetical protein